ncbi:MAG TPA: tRNA (adenosine(37)-N6)-dimethylallyltransferase MiaA [Candidatus Saccharimonadales bacterium]|nr:tRNA (adenosine(37)-N6)-dimethylallyltransferase MiaA [Candidatus Saccharimonadales bacterium]
MESKPDPTPLIVIVGETASGKTALSIELAKLCKGEIIAADSRTIYRGLTIGTAKPTPQEMDGVPHHLLDVVSPDQYFSAADFKRLANEAIHEIFSRGRVPFIVGGTGLYVDSVIYDFTFRQPGNPGIREQLEGLSVEALQQILIKKGIDLPENARNPRHLIRRIETGGEEHARRPLRANTLILGLSIERDVLRERLEKRVQLMLGQGLVQEVKALAERYGWDAPGMQSPGYRTFRKYLEGECTLEDTCTLLVREHMHLAKRQRTWFKRNKDIHYISKKEEAVDLVTSFLNKVYTDTGQSLLQ